MQAHQRLLAQVEHHVKRLTQGLWFAGEINGTGHFAYCHAVTVGRAQLAVDLITEIDRTFRTHRHTGITAGAQIKINRVTFGPAGGEGSQPARQAQCAAAEDRILAFLDRKAQLRGAGNALRKDGDIQRVRHQRGDLFGPVQRANDQQPSGAFVSYGSHRFSFGQMRGCQQCRNFRAGCQCVPAPAPGLANVDKTDDRGCSGCLFTHFGKQSFFLGASYHHIVTGLNGFLIFASFPATQR